MTAGTVIADAMDCRICSAPMRSVFVLHSQRHGVAVPVFRCRRCDAYFSNGGPVNYDDVDLTDYYLRHAPVIRARYEKVFARMESLLKPGRFLDIGAGMGFSLEIAQRHGWVSSGLEPNRSLAHNASERGLNIANAYLDDRVQGEHDFILIDNVLEHIPDPAAFLRNGKRLLAPSGIMLVVVPPIDWLRKGLAAIPYVRDRVGQPQINICGEVDEHLNMLGRRAMEALVDRAGMRMLPIRFHHSKVYDNPWFRAFGLDDGHYFIAST